VGPAHQPNAKDAVAVGEDSFEFAPDEKQPQRRITVWTYKPDGFGPNSPIVFVMHGVVRNGKGVRNSWIRHSRDGGFLLVVPEFPAYDYPTEAYQLGNVHDGNGRPLPREKWTFNAIEKLFDRAKVLTANQVDQYHIYGHSAGGQFVHRFVLFMPGARYARAIAANAGFYTFPTEDAAYPYGLRGTPITGQPKQAIFSRDFVLLLGETDTNRDRYLLQTPQADAQGPTRFERGKSYFRVATEIAKKENSTFNWRLITVADVGHSSAQMASAAVRELFSQPQ
jgi:pimeloyl-ACP methyl ester carboxylesterase